jgi:hypothetical protein
MEISTGRDSGIAVCNCFWADGGGFVDRRVDEGWVGRLEERDGGDMQDEEELDEIKGWPVGGFGIFDRWSFVVGTVS